VWRFRARFFRNDNQAEKKKKETKKNGPDGGH